MSDYIQCEEIGTIQRRKVPTDGNDDKDGKAPMTTVITLDKKNPSYKSKGKEKLIYEGKEKSIV
jgi:hypothetical protein